MLASGSNSERGGSETAAWLAPVWRVDGRRTATLAGVWLRHQTRSVAGGRLAGFTTEGSRERYAQAYDQTLDAAGVDVRHHDVPTQKAC